MEVILKDLPGIFEHLKVAAMTMQQGGAVMATLRCNHPKIEFFISAKREPGRLRMFNLSELVTDAFIDAVKQDTD
jgi:ribonucleotide reductase alpha subunit